MIEFKTTDLYGNELIFEFNGDIEEEKELITMLLGYEQEDDWEGISEVNE